MSEDNNYEVVSELTMAQLEALIKNIDESDNKNILLKFYMIGADHVKSC